MGVVCKILLWKRPVMSLLILSITTLSFFHCVSLKRKFIPLVADVLLVLTCSSAIIGFFSRFLHLPMILDFREWHISKEMAEDTVATWANMIGAAESVLRVAANGSDYRLFAKVVTFLYFLSVLGKLLSTPTIFFLGIWLMFTVPVIAKWVGLDGTACDNRAQFWAKRRKGVRA